MVERGSVALSGDRGLAEVRAHIENGLGDAPGGGSFEEVDIYDDFQRERAEGHRPVGDQAAEGRRGRRQRHGGPDGRPDPRAAPARARRDLLGARRRVPRPRAQPAAAREPRVHHRARCARPAPTSGSPGTATPTAASSSTATASSSPATSSPRCSPRPCSRRCPAPTSSTTSAPRRAVPGHGRAARRPRADQPRRPRVLQDPHARRGRRVRRRGLRPLLLQGVLQRRFGHDPRVADPRAALQARDARSPRCSREFRSKYFISGEINSTVADQRAKMDEIKARYADAEITELDGISVDYEDWHFNVRPSNTEPLLRLNLESLISQAGHGAPARRDARADPLVIHRVCRSPRRSGSGGVNCLPDRGRPADAGRRRPELRRARSSRSRTALAGARPPGRGPRADRHHPPARRPPRAGRHRSPTARAPRSARWTCSRRWSRTSRATPSATTSSPQALMLPPRRSRDDVVTALARDVARRTAAGAAARRSPSACTTAASSSSPSRHVRGPPPPRPLARRTPSSSTPADGELIAGDHLIKHISSNPLISQPLGGARRAGERAARADDLHGVAARRRARCRSRPSSPATATRSAATRR